MASRDELHRLVDTLPEGALENAKRILDHLQVWPPQMSPEMGRMRQIQQEQVQQMRRSMTPEQWAVGVVAGISILRLGRYASE